MDDLPAEQRTCPHDGPRVTLRIEYQINGWFESRGSPRRLCRECLIAFQRPGIPGGACTGWRWTVEKEAV